MPRFKATEYLKSFEHFDPDVTSRKAGRPIRAALIDLDGTVTGHCDDELSEGAKRTFALLGAKLDAISYLSNAGEDRVERLADYAIQASEAASIWVSAVSSFDVGQLKPSLQMFKIGEAVNGVPLDETVMVGDQIYKDAMGAWRAGCAAVVMVAPMGIQKEHKGTKYVQRPLEALYRLARPGVPFRFSDFGGAVMLDLPVAEGATREPVPVGEI